MTEEESLNFVSENKEMLFIIAEWLIILTIGLTFLIIFYRRNYPANTIKDFIK